MVPLVIVPWEPEGHFWTVYVETWSMKTTYIYFCGHKTGAKLSKFIDFNGSDFKLNFWWTIAFTRW